MNDIDLSKFKWGIEHEFPALNAAGEFCDFSNTTYEDFDRVIQAMPTFESDYPGLRVGDLGIKSKRWYIEGFERFSETGEYLRTDIKGFEIRTPICNSLSEAIATLKHDFSQWEIVAGRYGFTAASVAFNPFQEEFVPTPPLNAWEVEHRRTPEERTAYIHMLTSGPDISFSHPDLTAADAIAIGQKLTYYSPFIIPFTYSSPFYKGGLWGGLSRRTFYRTGKRPAVLVFVGDDADLIKSSPTLTDKARLPAEIGRIEFKAFDTIADLSLYHSLGALLLGIALDSTLQGRALVPDQNLHQHSATHGFSDAMIRNTTEDILDAAERVLPSEFHGALARLRRMLESRRSQANAMIDQFTQTNSILSAIKPEVYE
ncbi:MAG TPA: glutamate--cysteine ligase [Candidatus Paceibacterota bacterium]